MYWLITLIGRIKHIFDELSCTKNCAELEVGLQECDKAIRRINRNLRNAATIGEKQRLSTAMNNIKSYRTQIKHLRKKGRGIKETAKHRVHWEDTQSASHNRIHTGVITNIKHKDATHFLEDSKAIFERRIQSVIKKNSAVKVNVAFCGKFVISKADKVIAEFKFIDSFKFMNSSLDKLSSYLTEYPILKSELLQYTEEHIKLLTKKGVYPYDFTDSFDKFSYPHLPSLAVLPDMMKRSEGHIVFVSSVQGLFALPERSAYSASKHAIQAFADCLRAESSSYNISVTVVSPGYVKTNLSINALTGSGTSHGQMDEATEKGYKPEYVAEKIVRAVVEKTNEIVVSTITPKLALFLRKYLPSVYFSVMAHRAKKSLTLK
nr:unnamed protein product [Callosobruchus analis]